MDVETSGVYFFKHSIHEISGIIDIDGVVKEDFKFNVRPHPKALIEDEALKIGNVTKEQILAYPEQSVVYEQLINILRKYVNKFNTKDKYFLIGYNNAHFDNPFFRAFFK